jgi:hypothetical protein
VQPIREWVEGFLRGRDGVRLAPLVVPVLIGAILVVGWVLLGPLLTIPRFTTEGPVVRNGATVIVACGKKQGMAGMGAAMKYADEPGTGGWCRQSTATARSGTTARRVRSSALTAKSVRQTRQRAARCSHRRGSGVASLSSKSYR